VKSAFLVVIDELVVRLNAFILIKYLSYLTQKQKPRGPDKCINLTSRVGFLLSESRDLRAPLNPCPPYDSMASRKFQIVTILFVMLIEFRRFFFTEIGLRFSTKFVRK
jgi:hypothetical protein